MEKRKNFWLRFTGMSDGGAHSTYIHID